LAKRVKQIQINELSSFGGKSLTFLSPNQRRQILGRNPAWMSTLPVSLLVFSRHSLVANPHCASTKRLNIFIDHGPISVDAFFITSSFPLALRASGLCEHGLCAVGSVRRRLPNGFGACKFACDEILCALNTLIGFSGNVTHKRLFGRVAPSICVE
jgi:hypothetical protein